MSSMSKLSVDEVNRIIENKTFTIDRETKELMNKIVEELGKLDLNYSKIALYFDCSDDSDYEIADLIHLHFKLGRLVFNIRSVRGKLMYNVLLFEEATRVIFVASENRFSEHSDSHLLVGEKIDTEIVREALSKFTKMFEVNSLN